MTPLKKVVPAVDVPEFNSGTITLRTQRKTENLGALCGSAVKLSFFQRSLLWNI
jgi:hypothetical protein